MSKHVKKGQKFAAILRAVFFIIQAIFKIIILIKPISTSYWFKKMFSICGVALLIKISIYRSQSLQYNTLWNITTFMSTYLLVNLCISKMFKFIFGYLIWLILIVGWWQIRIIIFVNELFSAFCKLQGSILGGLLSPRNQNLNQRHGTHFVNTLIW